MRRVFGLALLVASALASAPASAQVAWQTISSKEGQFTVELPTKPTINQTRSRKGDGNVKTILLGCKTDAGVYLAYKVVMPTSIVKGTEDAELDAERDGMAKEWKGKVIAERKIKAGDKVGRDFTIQGKPEKGEGTLTIRIREYLSGNSVYLVAVVSAPNRELPEDTGRFLGSLAIGPGKVRAQGTPGVEPKGAEMPGWGLAIDPDKDCEIKEENKNLLMTVPATLHALGDGINNSPRVVREVEGDFVVTVKVVGEFRPGGKSTSPKSVPFNGAGIFVFSDSDNFIRLERAAVNRGGRISTYVNFEEFEGGTRGASHNEVMKGGDCWVRMERKGSRLQCGISFDGKAWKDLKPIQTVWPAKLKVGLLAVSSSGLPFSVAFEEFELKGTVKAPKQYKDD
jgi:regulation of enolase protein 1 (concanavalin A-like superfamily)